MCSRTGSGRLCLPLLTAALLAGCSPHRYPVEGKVTFEDGRPLTAGTVIGEATVDGQPVSAQGSVAPDGTFQLGGAKPGDGARAGSYRFVVMPVPPADGSGKQPDVDQRFTKFDTSGIALEVKAPANVLNIKVSPPPPPPEPEEDEKPDDKKAGGKAAEGKKPNEK